SQQTNGNFFFFMLYNLRIMKQKKPYPKNNRVSKHFTKGIKSFHETFQYPNDRNLSLLLLDLDM
ncbi:hypothetical protein POZ02_23620, partial [Phocaeicola vulgatus]|nr:hypothetical protein [Phocaeicola vulgatus]